MDYSKLADRTLSIITKYGRAITVSYFSPGTYNSTEGSYSSATYTNISTTGVFDTVAGLSGRQGLSGDALQTILEKKVDCVAYVPASGLITTPTIYDRVDANGRYEIVHVQELKPATVSLLFTLFLRRG